MAAGGLYDTGRSAASREAAELAGRQDGDPAQSTLVVAEEGKCGEVVLRWRGEKVTPLEMSGAGAGGMIVVGGEQKVYLWSGEGALETSEPKRLTTDASWATAGGHGTIVATTAEGVMLFRGREARTGLPAGMAPQPDELPHVRMRALSENALGEGVLAVTFPWRLTGLWEIVPGQPMRRVEGIGHSLVQRSAMAANGDALVQIGADRVLVREGGRWKALEWIPPQVRDAQQLFLDGRRRLWTVTSGGVHLLRTDWGIWKGIEAPGQDLHNHVLSLLVRRNGTLAVGAMGGLSIWRNDKLLESIVEVPGGTLENVTGLAEDSDGALWVSSGGGFRGLWRWRDGVWKHFGVKEGLADLPFHKVRMDGQGRLWAMCTGAGKELPEAGAYVLEGEKFTHWDTKRGLPSNRVYAMASGRDGAIWFAHRLGVSRWQGGWKHWGGEGDAEWAHIFDVVPRMEGGVYFVDRRQGLGMIDEKGQEAGANGESVAENALFGLLEDGQKRLWATTRAGLAVRQDGEWTMLGAKAGLKNPELWPVVEYEGSICVGTAGDGVQCLARDVPRASAAVARMVAGGDIAREGGDGVEDPRLRVRGEGGGDKGKVAAGWRGMDAVAGGERDGMGDTAGRGAPD